MKQTIKKFLGPEKSLKISKLRKVTRISISRFIRTILSGEESFPSLPARTFTLPDSHLFFGYYDVPQFSGDEKFLLATAAPLINSTPSANDQLRIGYFDLREENPGFREFGSTSTWCWQQGSRLQWYPAGSQETVIYNTMIDGHYGCVTQKVIGGEIMKSFQRPVYAVSCDGKWGLSLNFSRLQRLRPGYGYNTLPDDTENDLTPVSDGIWRIDMETGEEMQLFSVSHISEMSRRNTGDNAQHYFNHVLFNPAGDRFMFFHLRQSRDGSRNIHMLTSDINGDNIHMLNDSGHSSHYTWQDNYHLLCYSTVSGQGEGYYVYRDQAVEVCRFGYGKLVEDGHPSYLPDGRHLITDTYPDKYGEQALLLYGLNSENIFTIDKEFSPVRFNEETRCDLHPRVGPSGRYVCIDCIVSGKRAMKIFNISPLIK